MDTLAATSSSSTIAIVTPVLNDWQSLTKLLETINGLNALAHLRIIVVAVDDGSSDFRVPVLGEGPIERLKIVRLRANQGHARAIALGIAHVHEHIACDAVIVMDSDGEDRPEDLPALLKAHAVRPQSLIVAQRRRRSEGLIFRLFYQIYKLLFLWLTGKPISFGNFSLIPSGRLGNVVFNGGIWNSYSATLLRCRIPLEFVATDRGTRYFGASHMNFTSLLLHGMSAISVFSDFAIGRIIFALTFLGVMFGIAVSGVIAGKLITDYYQIEGYFIPGYTTSVILSLTNILLNAIFVGFLVILTLLATRGQAPALPTELLKHLVWKVEEVEAKAPVLAAAQP